MKSLFRAARRLGLVVLGSLWFVGSVGTLVAQAPAAEVPLKRVVLYFAGLAFYEHSGTVNGDATIRLTFKTSQMNDILKSLVLRDLGGGSIQAVTYAAQEPAQRSLRSFAIDLSGQPSLAGILRQIIGQELRLSAPDRLVGRLISLETRPRTVGSGPNPVVVDDTWLNLWTPEGIKSVALSQLAALELTDKRLQEELSAALNLLKSSADDERRSVDIVCKGSGSREIRFGYVQEAPVWKTSYRLDLSGAKPYIQGWALVENTSETDWKAVQLSLAGGQPIAFIQDLYTPLYASRPVVAPQQGAALRPQSYDQGLARNDPTTVSKTPGGPAAAAPAIRGAQAEMGAGDGYFMNDVDKSIANNSVQSVAVAGREGETFFFGLRDPLNLPRRQSAMMPIVTGDVDGEQVSIYNQTVNAKRPLLGVWLRGLAGLRLPAGPMAVYAGSLYAGDSLLDTLGEKERRLLSYGVDLDVQVDPSNSSSRVSTTFSLVQGVLVTKTAWKYSTTYAIKNNGSRSRQVLVEHPFNAARILSAGLKYEEKTDRLYRFVVPVGAGVQQNFPVAEEQTVSESVSLLNLRSSAFSTWTNGALSPAVKAALVKAASLKFEAERLADRVQEIQRRQTELAQDQGRIRANLESVGRDSTQGKQYLQKLSAEENELDGLAKELASTRASQTKAQKEVEEYLKTLTVE